MSRVKEALGMKVVQDVGQLYQIDAVSAAFARGHHALWEEIYRGAPFWVDGKGVRGSLNVAKTVCEYLAGYNTAELCIAVDGEGSPAGRFVQAVLERNSFAANLSVAGELCEALGGLVLKPYNRGGEVLVDFVPARCFLPISWDNRGMLEGVFLSEYVRGNRIYTRVEAHLFEVADGARQVVIENRLFVRSAKGGAGLGVECALDCLPELAGLATRARFPRERPLFVYLKPALANNLEPGCPLGVSRFANAVGTLEALDKAFAEWQRDRVDSRKKIIAPAEWFRRTLDEHGRPIVEYDRECGVYQRVDYRPGEAQQPVVFAPEYAVDKWVRDIDALLDLLCVQVGLSPGAISFDAQGGIKTAAEVRSENARTFKTIARNQVVLRQGVRDLVEAVLYLAQHPDFGLLAPGEHEIAVDFDDSVTPDREGHIAEGSLLAQAGLISRRRFLTAYLGLTGQQADEEMARLGAEQSAER